MSRPAAAMNPASANRKFIILAVVLGLLGAILVYVAAHRGGSSSGSFNGVPVVVASQDIPARTKLAAGMLEVRLLPSDNRSALSYSDMSTVVNKITRFPINANEQVPELCVGLQRTKCIGDGPVD